MSILFCNIGWMNEYQGVEGDPIERGGAYNINNIGHEVCNFYAVGKCIYGYVQPTGQIKIERLGANKNDESISGITVVWVAGPKKGGTVVVGWYKNATVFRNPQDLPKLTTLQKENNLSHYYISALKQDVTLLPPNERTLLIPRSVKGGIGQSNVWFADSDESKVHLKKVWELLDKGFLNDLPDLDNDITGNEGSPRLVNHLKRERNVKIVKKKKAQVLNATGKLSCEACDFDFKETYGELGENFCEVHHLIQLSKADGVVKTTLNDLAILCSNCHRIIHRQDPMLTVEGLKHILTKEQSK